MKKPDWRIWIKDKKECRSWLIQYIKKGMLRERRDESRLHLGKADHNLNMANWLMEKHDSEIPGLFGEETFYDWVISAYYYAIYHAALSLMSREGYSSKNHSATLCFLIYHHYHEQRALDMEDVEIVAGSLDKQDIDAMGSSKEMRERASYDVHGSFERRLADHVRGQATGFINKIKSLLD